MRLLEHESKRLLAAAGVPTPTGKTASTPDQAAQAASDLDGPVALKAQILAGGRGKAGGILFADSPEGARRRAGRLLGSELCGHPVKELLVEAQLDIDKELFAAVTYDEVSKAPMLVASRAGGVDINQAIAEDRSRLLRIDVNPWYGLQPFEAYGLADILDLPTGTLRSAQRVFLALWTVFADYDATLVEVNPLALSPAGRIIAVDAHIEIEGDALFRQMERLAALGIQPREDRVRPPTPFEAEANLIDKDDYRGVAGRVIEFDGELGLLIGAGGGSLTAFDAIQRYGGRPANYCEIGGNPPVSKVYRLAKLVLSKPGVKGLAVITNVYSNSRVDFLARGVVKALVELGIDPGEYPVLFRSAGAFEEDGYAILRKYGIRYLTRDVSMDQAGKAAVEMMAEVA